MRSLGHPGHSLKNLKLGPPSTVQRYSCAPPPTVKAPPVILQLEKYNLKPEMTQS